MAYKIQVRIRNDIGAYLEIKEIIEPLTHETAEDILIDAFIRNASDKGAIEIKHEYNTMLLIPKKKRIRLKDRAKKLLVKPELLEEMKEDVLNYGE